MEGVVGKNSSSVSELLGIHSTKAKGNHAHATLCPSIGSLQLELQQVPASGGRILFTSQEGTGLA